MKFIFRFYKSVIGNEFNKYSIVFEKKVVKLFSYLHIYWEEFYRHIFLQTYFLQIYKLNTEYFYMGILCN